MDIFTAKGIIKVILTKSLVSFENENIPFSPYFIGVVYLTEVNYVPSFILFVLLPVFH